MVRIELEFKQNRMLLIPLSLSASSGLTGSTTRSTTTRPLEIGSSGEYPNSLMNFLTLKGAIN
jgi:hypothetical protein